MPKRRFPPKQPEKRIKLTLLQREEIANIANVDKNPTQEEKHTLSLMDRTETILNNHFFDEWFFILYCSGFKSDAGKNSCEKG